MSQKLNSTIAVIGIDIGKNSFHIVGQDQRGSIVLRQKWSRGQVEARPDLLDPRAVLGPVKAWPGNVGAIGKIRPTASLDGPCARRVSAIRRPGRRNGCQARTKEQGDVRRLLMT
jgi:hypothetical protein